MVNLSEFQVGQICGCLSLGARLADAADSLELSVDDLKRLRKTDRGFASQLRQAERKGKLHHLNKIFKADHWQSSAWILERRWPREFSKFDPKRRKPVRDIYDLSRLDSAQQGQLFALLRRARQPGGSIEQTSARGPAPGLPAPANGANRSDDLPAESA